MYVCVSVSACAVYLVGAVSPKDSPTSALSTSILLYYTTLHRVVAGSIYSTSGDPYGTIAIPESRDSSPQSTGKVDGCSRHISSMAQ